MAASAVMNRVAAQVDAAHAPSTTGRAFQASAVYDRLAGLVLIVAAAGAVGALWATPGTMLGAVFVALGLSLYTFWLKPSAARFTAPAYALVEGFALGGISAYYASFGGGIIPLAVVFTGATFIGSLVLHRTGLIPVNATFFRTLTIASVGFIAILVASSLGLPLPGLSDLGTRGLLFGGLGLVLGVASLLADFALVESLDGRGDAATETYAAFGLLTSLVLVYLSLLRLFGSRR